MVRSAAKNFQDVLVVVDPADYPRVLAELERPGGVSGEFRFDLAKKAFAHTAAYDTAIAGTLGEFTAPKGVLRGRATAPVTPARLTLTLRKIKDSAVRREPPSTGGMVCDRRGRGPGRCGGAARQGAVVYQSARSRFGCTHCAGVQRAGRRGDQAHEPVRRGDRPLDRGGVCPRARGRPIGGVWRHHRAQSPDRRRSGAGARVRLSSRP